MCPNAVAYFFSLFSLLIFILKLYGNLKNQTKCILFTHVRPSIFFFDSPMMVLS